MSSDDDEDLLADEPPQEIVDGIWVGNHVHASEKHDFDVIYSIGYSIADEAKYELHPDQYKYCDL